MAVDLPGLDSKALDLMLVAQGFHLGSFPEKSNWILNIHYFI